MDGWKMIKDDGLTKGLKTHDFHQTKSQFIVDNFRLDGNFH